MSDSVQEKSSGGGGDWGTQEERYIQESPRTLLSVQEHAKALGQRALLETLGFEAQGA